MLYMEQRTEYLTVEQVASKLGVSLTLVRRWLQDKELVGYKFGRDWKVKPEDLEKFIESKRNA